jgi:hypothetical protein
MLTLIAETLNVGRIPRAKRLSTPFMAATFLWGKMYQRAAERSWEGIASRSGLAFCDTIEP